MKNIQELMNASQIGLQGSAEKLMNVKESQPSSRLSKKTTRQLWERMIGIYGHSWKSAFGEFPEDESGTATLAGDTWSRVLADITNMQIAIGLDECRFSGGTFPPTAPKFRAMCLGVISLATVKDQLLKGYKCHPFTRMVSSKLDWFLYKRADTNNANILLKEAYDASYEAVLRGEPLPASPTASLDAPEKGEFIPAPKEVAEKHLSMIREILA